LKKIGLDTVPELSRDIDNNIVIRNSPINYEQLNNNNSKSKSQAIIYVPDAETHSKKSKNNENDNHSNATMQHMNYRNSVDSINDTNKLQPNIHFEYNAYKKGSEEYNDTARDIDKSLISDVKNNTDNNMIPNINSYTISEINKIISDKIPEFKDKILIVDKINYVYINSDGQKQNMDTEKSIENNVVENETDIDSKLNNNESMNTI
jgi:hypothetical protein